MSMLGHPELFIFISSVFLSLYYTGIKRFPYHIMLLYFWVHLTTYATCALMYVFNKSAFLFDTSAIEQLVFDTNYQNLPLFFLSSACFVGSIFILQTLIKSYPVPTVLAVSQLSTVFSTLGYLVLGDTVSKISLMGISIIVFGALISGLTSFSWRHPITSFEQFDSKLLKYSLLNAILNSGVTIITYICTSEYSVVTKEILHTLTKHIHIIPFVPMAPIHFNIGVQFTNLILVFLFIKFYVHESNDIIKTFKASYKLLLVVAACYILNVYFYYTAYDFIRNKNIITAISKLYLPMTLFFSHMLLQAKVSKEQCVGMAIIVVGSIITIYG